jgi:hypothetical protein
MQSNNGGTDSGSTVLVDSRRVGVWRLGHLVGGPWCGTTADSVAVWTPR